MMGRLVHARLAAHAPQREGVTSDFGSRLRRMKSALRQASSGVCESTRRRRLAFIHALEARRGTARSGNAARVSPAAAASSRPGIRMQPRMRLYPVDLPIADVTGQ